MMYEILKKYWKAIVGFIASIATLLCVNYFRNRAIRANLQRVNNQLAESDAIISKLSSTNRELENELEQSRSVVYKLESEFNNSIGNAEELERINTELTDESNNVETILSKFRKFLDEASETE